MLFTGGEVKDQLKREIVSLYAIFGVDTYRSTQRLSLGLDLDLKIESASIELGLE